MRTYPDPPVTFVRGEGSWLFDLEGRKYLDFLCGLAVTSIGHCHPEVERALCHQAGTLVHVSNLFANLIGPEVATTLDGLIGGGGRVFFTNSGAEANECAVKLVRKWAGPGRFAVVSTYGSFHGRTLATLAATGQPDKHEPFQPLPEGFRLVAWDDIDQLDAALDPSVVAGVLLEVIQGEGGVNQLSPGYLRELRSVCDEKGIALILDEVQTGLGRTGEWFAFQHAGITPDVVTVAKALGNGVPIGACWALEEVADAFVPGDHGSTFGGQPLASAAARATLRVMQKEDVPARAAKSGTRLMQGLEAIPGIDYVKGQGLLLGAVLEDGDRPNRAKAVAERALSLGLVVNAVRPDTLRLAPSLLVSHDEIDLGLSILAEALV